VQLAVMTHDERQVCAWLQNFGGVPRNVPAAQCGTHATDVLK